MDLSDNAWKEKWIKVYNEPVLKIEEDIWGTAEEPYSSLWLANLSESMGENFKEEMVITDYGCGGGRYANFISQRLNNYCYYGLERRGGVSEKSISLFLNDTISKFNNLNFGFIGEEIEKEALNISDVVVLGSIFTHLLFECDDESPEGDSFITIFGKFISLIQRGGVVVFSVFIADEMFVDGGSNSYGIPNCYGRSYYTLESLQEYCDINDLILTECENFVAQEVNKHRIFMISNQNNVIGGV